MSTCPDSADRLAAERLADRGVMTRADLLALYDTIHHPEKETPMPTLPDLTSWHLAQPGEILPAGTPYVRQTIGSPDASLIYMPHGRRNTDGVITDGDVIWTAQPLSPPAPPAPPLPTESGSIILAHHPRRFLALLRDGGVWRDLHTGMVWTADEIGAWQPVYLTLDTPAADHADSTPCCTTCGTEDVGAIYCARHRPDGDPRETTMRAQLVATLVRQYLAAHEHGPQGAEAQEIVEDMRLIAGWLAGGIPGNASAALGLCPSGQGHWGSRCDEIHDGSAS